MNAIHEILGPAIRGLQTTEIPTNTRTVEAFDWNFAIVGDEHERRILEAMLKAAKLFCSAMQRGEAPRFLSLLGACGAGKTHLARRITAFFHRNCELYREPKTGSLLARRGGFKCWRSAAGDIAAGDFSGLRMLESDWFVVLDDIGAEHASASGISTSKLDQILSARAEQRWTVITSNQLLEQWAERERRIASRMKRGASAVIECRPPFLDYCFRKPIASAA